jgi:uncharacterized repeat protein (TIGR03843 family)
MTTMDADVLETLKHGEIVIKGEFLWGSNFTFLVNVALNGLDLKGVYKPTRGEKPLWDFPAASLARREAAAYLVSEALGWSLVPPTMYRRKAPLGPGSLQLYIEHDPEYHYFTFSEKDMQRLRPVALFDLVINNADRKGSHVLIDPADHIWLIDHGICFHVDEKIRTVIWDFAGEPLPDVLCSSLNTFREKFEIFKTEKSEFETGLKSLLSLAEIKAIAQRVDRLLESGRYPSPNPYRRPYPWPQI